MLYVLEEKSTNESGFTGVRTLPAVCNSFATTPYRNCRLQTLSGIFSEAAVAKMPGSRPSTSPLGNGLSNGVHASSHPNLQRPGMVSPLGSGTGSPLPFRNSSSPLSASASRPHINLNYDSSSSSLSSPVLKPTLPLLGDDSVLVSFKQLKAAEATLNGILAEKQKLKDQCKAWAELSNVNFSEQVQAAAVRISQLDMDERRAQADYDAKSSMNAKTEHAKSMQAVAAAKSQAYERARHEAQQAIHREQRALAEWTQAKEDEAQAKRDLKASEANGVH